MTQVVLFHSVLGAAPWHHRRRRAAERPRAASHQVLVVDQNDSRAFDDYVAADAFTQTLGYPELMRRATEAVEPLADGFVVASFSNGGAMAKHVATQRPVAGVLMLSGALPLKMLGADAWSAGAATGVSCREPVRGAGHLAVLGLLHLAAGHIWAGVHPPR